MTLGFFNSFGKPGGHTGNTLTLAALNAPASTALLAEQGGNTADPTNPAEANSGVFDRYFYEGTGTIGQPAYYTDLGATSARHTDGANWLACDGHVKYIKPGVVSVGEGYGAANYVPTPPGPSSDTACGTSVMTDSLGTQYTITMSPS